MEIMAFIHHLPLVSIFGLNLLTIFGLLGNTISVMVFLSPIPTFYTIYKKKSTEGYQCIPYVVALFSSMLWILYALIVPNLTFLKTINSFGILIETVYITIFLIYATRKDKISTMKLMFVMNVAGFGAITFMTFVVAKSTQVRIKILGWVCLVFSLCVFVAPLGVVRQVIRTKSVQYMPFLLSFFLTINAVMWFFYGLVKNDYYLAIPNVFGFTFGIVQMILYAIYRKSKTSIIEVQKISELGITADHQILEVVKLGPQENLSAIETPQLSVVANENEEGTYTIEIRNVNQDMIEKIKKIGGVGNGVVQPNLVTVAAV